MPAKKIRVEVLDSEGNRYSLSFEGQVTRDKALRLLDLVELLGGMPAPGDSAGGALAQSNDLSKYDRVRLTVQKHFPVVWFSSRDVQTVYEQELKEPVGLSTVATYLSRLSTKGVLLKSGAANRLKYKLAPAIPQAAIKQRLP